MLSATRAQLPALLLVLLTAARASESATTACPPPWVKFRSLCLVAGCAHKTWHGSRQTCRSLGGDLVWMTSLEEHRTVSEFYMKNIGRCFNYYLAWTGLHHNDRGALEWSRRDAGNYRGIGLYMENAKYFVIAGNDVGKFAGFSDPSRMPFICRRA